MKGPAPGTLLIPIHELVPGDIIVYSLHPNAPRPDLLVSKVYTERGITVYTWLELGTGNMNSDALSDRAQDESYTYVVIRVKP